MIIKSAEFIISAVSPTQYPTGSLPEIALVGRSNVGKSSLINTLVNRKGLARTSSTPGKTQLLNFYFLNKEFYFVDLPGYGYAKVAKTTKSNWGKMIETYLAQRENLVGIIQLVDARHEPSKDDLAMQDWIQHQGTPSFVVATKIDKISRGNWAKHQKMIRENLGIEENSLVLFSAQTRQGKEAVLERVEKWTQGQKEEDN